MFAHTVEFNIPDNDHVILFRGENGTVNHIFQILPIAAGQVFQTFFHPFRSLQQTFPFRILAEFRDNFPYFFLHNPEKSPVVPYCLC